MITLFSRCRRLTFTSRTFSPSFVVRARQRYLSCEIPLARHAKETSNDGIDDDSSSASLLELKTLRFVKESRLDDALHTRRQMLDENLKLSPMVYARLLALQRHTFTLSEDNFRRRMDQCLFKNPRPIHVARLTELMKSLEETEIRIGVMEEIFEQYVAKTRSSDIRALGGIIATLIYGNLAEGNTARAKHWLDFYCEKVAANSPPKESVDNVDAAPFTTYIRGMSRLRLSTKEAAHDHSPVITKMQRAQVWPDTAFLNALLQAELLQDRPTQALALYELLRRDESVEKKLSPDAETYSNLFETFRRFTRRQRQMWKRDQASLAEEGSDVRPLTPWDAFSDMVHSQRQILSSRLEDAQHQQPDVLTIQSNIAALRMFVETSDYTCALAALACFAEFRLPLVAPRSSQTPDARRSPASASGIILHALVNRCRSELGPRRSNNVLPTWTDLFLGLAPGERAQLMHLPRSVTEQRVLQLAARKINYEQYPALKSFIVSDEQFASKDLPPELELEARQARWRSRQLRVLSTLLHHAIIAEANLALANRERPEDVLLRSLLSSDRTSSTKSRLFM
ncbi:hypothetical protein SCHPADRAFT_903790 [Schizopora paradoxa]|uniref:Uncharacterized protein n=1 Tax=Schizopora paradoxa TaxID=27342 RepID=A0A0H2RPK8_9AGAM|nr:hypothetical protein SCHPADRAFT_903790 [Schizopora paradoxa]